MFKTIENSSAVRKDDIIDLGVASVETRGVIPGPEDDQPLDPKAPAGLIAD